MIDVLFKFIMLLLFVAFVNLVFLRIYYLIFVIIRKVDNIEMEKDNE